MWLILSGESSKAAAAAGKGINQFWLIALKNCEIFADVIKVENNCFECMPYHRL
jgi:hypothetical protein